MAHEVRDKATGVPILGSVDPAQKARADLEALAAEKANLAADDHDWVLQIIYNVSEVNARAVTALKVSNIPVTTPIPLTNHYMRGDSLPTCIRCAQTYDHVADQPCPGMTFEEYMMRLDEETREQVLASLRQQAAEMGRQPDTAAVMREVPIPEAPAPSTTEPTATT